MAIIRLAALVNANGPMIPSELFAWIKDCLFPNGGLVPVLCLSVGADTVEIWPADQERLLALAAKLEQLAQKLNGVQKNNPDGGPNIEDGDDNYF